MSHRDAHRSRENYNDGEDGADIDDDYLPDDEETEEFKRIMTENEMLAKENRLFDSYLHRTLGELNMKMDDLDAIRQMPDEYTIPMFLKLSMAVQEHEIRTNQVKKVNAKAVEDVNLLKAIIEGIKIRIDELRKETYEFQRDIVLGSETEGNNAVVAEKVVEWFESKLKAKDNLIEKLELKNKAMKEHRYNMDMAVRHKENQGDNLHSIDFHQLQIKNQQYNQKIKLLNKELLSAKATTVRTVQVLNTKKKELSDILAKGSTLKADIKDREGGLIRLQFELEKVGNEIKKDEAKNKKFKIQQSNPDMPHVLDYVKQKSQMYELEGAVRNWARKVDIIEMAGQRARRIIRQASELRQAQARAVVGSFNGRSTHPGGGPMLPNIGR